jgi:autotransporter family porin
VCLRPTLYNGSSITLIADAVGWTPGGPARGPGPAPPVPPTPGPGPGPAPGEKFVTLPPGSALPGDAECAARVRPAPEIRPDNATQNATRGTNPNDKYPRVTGDFTGTTDEILQWAACKWGIDEDIVRAQIAKESWWNMDNVGDGGESFGLGQVRVPYHQTAFEDDNAKKSSSYNVDYTYAGWRSCYEGNETWLNQFERGQEYAAGDHWGCLGVWFSGRWHVPDAEQYIAAVQDYLSLRIWETPDFANG